MRSADFELRENCPENKSAMIGIIPYKFGIRFKEQQGLDRISILYL